MAGQVLNGRREAKKVLSRLKREIQSKKIHPLLATIQVGRRPDATLYLRLKAAAAATIGIQTEQHRLPASITQIKITSLIKELNHRPDVTGILLQLPLPRHLQTNRIIAAIAPGKDVDGFSPHAVVIPPPIAAVLHLVVLAKPKKLSEVALIGKDSVFTTELARYMKHDRVTIVPAAAMFSPSVKRADIIVTASGRGPRLMRKHIKPGVIVIDVGIRHVAGRVAGDAHPSVYTRAKAYSPVPGGVGPLTIAFVLKNTVDLS